MEKFVLKHRWNRKDMPFILYTEQELRKIHKYFGHHSLGAMTTLVKKAIDHNAREPETRKYIEAIRES